KCTDCIDENEEELEIIKEKVIKKIDNSLDKKLDETI
ncbi:MAG: hypothetical protein ACI9Q3_000501, partial [Maribacter sp.]